MVVRRSAVKMWAISVGSIPLLVIAIDVLTQRRITDWLRELIFAPADTQIYEPRDVIFAWAMFLFAAGVVTWGLKELFWPTKVIEGREAGLALKLRGPFRPHDVVPWTELIDVSAGVVEDEGDSLPALEVRVLTRGDLPEHPWGARWVDERVLAILAQDWSKNPTRVVDQITEYAIDVAKVEAREQAHQYPTLEEEE